SVPKCSQSSDSFFSCCSSQRRKRAKSSSSHKRISGKVSMTFSSFSLALMAESSFGAVDVRARLASYNPNDRPLYRVSVPAQSEGGPYECLSFSSARSTARDASSGSFAICSTRKAFPRLPLTQAFFVPLPLHRISHAKRSTKL